MFDPLYIQQAKLLLRCLPEIKKHACFALKGGTAINLFFRPMSRLSVDIDLTYLPLSNRETALADIARTMEAIKHDILKRIVGARVQSSRGTVNAGKLVVSLDNVHIKIEPNQILRGSVYATETRDLCAEAQSLFELFVSAQTLSLADVYGGKLCAALDRQHPRDLYDVRLLLASEGLTPQIRRAFVVYLASHHRPMNELLAPKFKNIAKTYADEFAGMAREEVPLESLCETREQLVRQIRHDLDANEKRFLLSVKRGEPDQDALGIPHLLELPALQWKIRNINRMDDAKRHSALAKLEQALAQ